MNKRSLIFFIGCSIITSTPTYGIFGISELVATIIAGSCCFVYEHKRIDFTNRTVKTLKSSVSAFATTMQTVTQNTSILANNTNILACNLQQHISLNADQDLQDMRDSACPTTTIRRPPAQLPRVVIAKNQQQIPAHLATLPMPSPH